MMKLRHLFLNDDLAYMLLMNWQHDESALGDFKCYRNSANAIYTFQWNGETFFLRFSPVSEKSKDAIRAELEFIGYLHGKHYNAVEPVPSKTGDLLVHKFTPWGEYCASVFKHVPGKQLSGCDLNDDILFTLGASLGRLHQLSSEYVHPQVRRWTHGDVLDWMERTLKENSADELPLKEVAILRDYFAALPVNQEDYGLIHYDFELDNVFYDVSTKSCQVIDFDDAMYHWYAMDIDQTIDSFQEECSEEDFLRYRTRFIEGYRSKISIDEGQLARLPVFRRFANLYGYTRILRSIQECWENEPEWMCKLRVKLNRLLEKRAVSFGKVIEQSTHTTPTAN